MSDSEYVSASMEETTGSYEDDGDFNNLTLMEKTFMFFIFLTVVPILFVFDCLKEKVKTCIKSVKDA